MGAAIATPKGKSLPSPPPSLIRRHKKRGNVLASCGDCKKEHNASESVPYIVHEASMARMERQAKRLWITVLALIVILVATNGAWIWYCNQWGTVESWEITQENDGGYNNYIGNDGDIVNGETNNPEN